MLWLVSKIFSLTCQVRLALMHGFSRYMYMYCESMRWMSHRGKKTIENFKHVYQFFKPDE